jgi:predicted  nucleic acid-binding Zn-ribbon protein
MSVADTLNALAAKISDLYREIVTTSVRFDELRRSTEKTLSRLESTVDQLAGKISAIHDSHVRERAALEAQIEALQGRLTALSEQALHSVVREVAREMVADSLRESPPPTSKRLNDATPNDSSASGGA